MADTKDIVLHGGPSATRTYSVASMVHVVTIGDDMYIKTEEVQTIKGRKHEVFQFMEETHAEESKAPDPAPAAPARRRGRKKSSV